MSGSSGWTELGRIERPEAEQYRAQRKLYLVPLVYTPKEPPADYVATLARYVLVEADSQASARERGIVALRELAPIRARRQVLRRAH